MSRLQQLRRLFLFFPAMWREGDFGTSNDQTFIGCRLGFPFELDDVQHDSCESAFFVAAAMLRV